MTHPLPRRGVLAAGAALLAAPARAQAWPARPIRIVVPFSAGGGYDVTARLLAEPLSRELGQSVVVDNRTGGGGALGLEAVWRAPPDGYTLALTGAAVITAGPHLRKPPYEPLDFAHITRLVRMPFLIVAKKDLPAGNLAEFVALAKRQTLTYATSGAGTSQHLTGELFNQTAGVKMTMVPYRGTTPALNDLVAGVVDAAVADSSALQIIRGGGIKAIAVTSPDRWSLLPETPAAVEQIRGCVSENWYGLAAPPGTPEDIQRHLHAAIAKVLADQALRARYDASGLHVALMETAAFRDFIRADDATWKGVVERGQIIAEG